MMHLDFNNKPCSPQVTFLRSDVFLMILFCLSYSTLMTRLFICQNCVVLHLEKSGNVVFRPDFVTPATLASGLRPSSQVEIPEGDVSVSHQTSNSSRVVYSCNPRPMASRLKMRTKTLISQKGDFGLKSLWTIIAEKNSSKSAVIGIMMTHHPLKTA